MSTKYYVLMQVGFDYDDQNYSIPQGGGGHPTLVFTNKKKAEEECTKRNREEMKVRIQNGELREYANYLDEILHSQVLEEELMYEEGIFMQAFGVSAEEWWRSCRHTSYSSSLQKLSEEQWNKLLDCFLPNYFWEVVTVEKG
jgi:hypothetical protein